MRSTQARIFTWVFVAIALTFWVMQARRGNPYLNAKPVSVAELGDEIKRGRVHYVGSDDEFHYFQSGGEEQGFFLRSGDRNISKLPKADWAAPARIHPYFYPQVKLKDGKLVVETPAEARHRRGDPDSGEDQDFDGR